MSESDFRLSYTACRHLLMERLQEPAPGRIQLLAGPRQVGKTTLLLEIASAEGKQAIYTAADSPEAALPGFWERIWIEAEQVAAAQGRAVVLLDEVHLFPDWSRRVKAEWDRLKRRKTPVHIVATGSSALRVSAGSRESLAGRFERIVLTHWQASSLSEVFKISRENAAETIVQSGGYPGAFGLRADPGRWLAYMRDAIVEPAIGRDILALASLRKPALLRQVFAVAASSPAQIVSLQKIQGQLQDAGALETVAHYLGLLEEAYLVAALTKFSARSARSRSAPPKLVTLSNALLAVMDARGTLDVGREPERAGQWIENACLAFAWNSGQSVRYWREEPLEVDGVIEGSWGTWALEIKTGSVQTADLRALLEFARRFPEYRPLLVCGSEGLAPAQRAGIAAITWRDFLMTGPPGNRAP
jgi:predicted AAA+ superfamily ATPase